MTPTVPPRRRWLSFLFIAALSAVVTLVLTTDRMPRLTPEALGDASSRWRAAQTTSYHLTLELSSSELEPSVYRIAVRDGRVETLENEGRTLESEATAYDVPGLHDLLRQELALVEDPNRAHGAPAGYATHLFAEFDDRGVPTRFRRVVGGTRRWAEWRIVEFIAPDS